MALEITPMPPYSQQLDRDCNSDRPGLQPYGWWLPQLLVYSGPLALIAAIKFDAGAGWIMIFLFTTWLSNPRIGIDWFA